MATVPPGLLAALQDRYRLDRELGQGGMARVYLAHDLKHGRQVALKVLRPELATALGWDRFLAEIRLTAKLQHPHILTLIDSGEDGGFLWYVLPYVPGESLRQKLDREKQLSLADTLAIARQVASALDHAHRQGVIHRDIKPENILLHEGQAMLADFGIALAVKEAGGERLTQSGLSIGTPIYMSPEQATAERALDPRSDVYALGTVVYEMLAGSPPFTGATQQAIIARLLVERPAPIRTVRSTVPPGVERAVLQALAKVPADRFDSAGEFAQALDAPESGRLRQWLGASRRRVWTYVAAAAACGLLTWGWVALRQRPKQPAVGPESLQITFTGDADVPATSRDGRRLAYVTRDCDSAGSCGWSVVVQDLDGVARSVVATHRRQIDDLTWSHDDRFLVFHEYNDATFGTVFAVSTLGGPVVPLGHATAGDFLGTSDTILLIEKPWLHLVTVSDGRKRDSIRISGDTPYFAAFGSPDGRRICVETAVQESTFTLKILSRSGSVLDSTRYHWADYYFVRWAPGGTGLLLSSQRGHTGLYDILRVGVSSSGHLAPAPDTVLRKLPLSLGHFQVDESGRLVYPARAQVRELYAVNRVPGTGFRFSTRRFSGATGAVRARLSPSGDQVIFATPVPGGNRRVAFSMVPFGGGAVTSLGPPVDGVKFWDVIPQGSGIILGLTDTRGDAVGELSGGTVRVLHRTQFPINDVSAITGGGFMIAAHAMPGCQFQRIGVSGMADTAIVITDSTLGCVIWASPDGRAGVMVATTIDSVVLFRVPFVAGKQSMHVALPPAGFQGAGASLGWMADGAVEFGLQEESGQVAWYHWAASGAPPQRLGTMPFPDAFYSVAGDGRRFLAVVETYQTDIQLVNRFGEMLRR